MNYNKYIDNKIQNIDNLLFVKNKLQFLNKKIVFTNGCFDLLHAGHLHSLQTAAAFGDYLIVGINSDASVQKLKGPNRPINNEQSRAAILANLLVVDAVIIFDDETPIELIKCILPDVLVKGGDYTVDETVGSKEVIANGGTVEIVPLIKGISTTNTVLKMQKQ